MEKSEYVSNEESPLQTIEFVQTILNIVNALTLHITTWLPIVLFAAFWILSMFASIWTGYLNRTLPAFLNTVIWDMMYIPAMRSFVSVMVCTYTCNYFGQPDSFKPYPSLDMLPTISCASPGYYVWFVAAILAVAIHHPQALNFVAFKKNESDPALRLLPRFNVLFYVAKVYRHLHFYSFLFL